MPDQSFNPLPTTSVLSIAGFDPSGGAGVLADVKTFEANGVYGLGVVSALTFQNDAEFDGVKWIPVNDIEQQIAVLLRRFEVKYVKIGLIESYEVLQQIISFLKKHIDKPIIVFDPIIKASAGFQFHNNASEFASLLQDVYCITPNIPEAEWILQSVDLNEQLELLSEQVNIYLKGGHADNDTITDLLYTSDHTYAFANDRLPYGTKHGSGCVLSASLTAQLALGHDLPKAAENANAYPYRFLGSSKTLLGTHQSINS